MDTCRLGAFSRDTLIKRVGELLNLSRNQLRIMTRLLTGGTVI